MADYLVFRLYGPMVAWGDIAVGEQRPIYARPSKSAILGFVAASLGIERRSEQDLSLLSNTLGMATYTDRPGVLLRDYHTVQVRSSGTGRNKKQFINRAEELDAPRHSLNTSLTQRDYMCDASSWIVLWDTADREKFSLEEIKQALKKPRFIPYLGRKSCPISLPLLPQIVRADSSKEAFVAVAKETPDFLLPHLAAAKYIAFGTDEVDVKDAIQRVVRRDAVLSRKRWQFKNRFENIGQISSLDTQGAQDVS